MKPTHIDGAKSPEGINKDQKSTLEAEKILSPEELLVEENRERFIKESLACDKEKKRLILIEKTRIATFNILAGAKNIFSNKDNKIEKEKLDEEQFLTEGYKESKKAYDHARVELGNTLLNTKRVELRDSGLEGEELEKALKEYKATEILNKIIIEEREKMIRAKADSDSLSKPHWKKATDWYLSKPRWARVAMSTAFFLPAAAAGTAGASIVAGYGLAGLATVKFAQSMATGTLLAQATKLIDVAKRKKDALFIQNQTEQRANLSSLYANNSISLEEYEQRASLIDKEDKKRERNRLILKASVGILLGASAGALASGALTAGISEGSIDTVEPQAPKMPDASALVGKGEGVTHPLSRQIEALLENKEQAEKLGFTGGDAHAFAIKKAAELAHEYGYIRNDGLEIRLNEQAIGHTAYEVTLNPDGTLAIHESFDGVTHDAGTLDSYETIKETQHPPKLVQAQEPVLKAPVMPDDLEQTQNGEQHTEGRVGAPQENTTLEHTRDVSRSEMVGSLSRAEFEREVEHYLRQVKNASWETKASHDADMWKWEKFGGFERIPQPDGTFKLHFIDPESNPYLVAVQGSGATAEDLMMADASSPQFVVGKELVALREEVLQKTGVAINPNPGESMDAYTKRAFSALTGEVVPGPSSVTPLTETEQPRASQTNTETTENTTETAGSFNPYKSREYIENGKDIEKISDARRIFTSQPRNVVLNTPETTTHGTSHYNWNKATEKVFETENVSFSSFDEFEKERTLQNLFAHSEQREGNAIVMDYFREQKDWNTIQKIPAGAFIENDTITLANGEVYKFENRAQLLRLRDAYMSINPRTANPFPNETIEQYVGRLTKTVHQSTDGVFFAPGKDIKYEPVTTRGQVPQGAPSTRVPLPPFMNEGAGDTSNLPYWRDRPTQQNTGGGMWNGGTYPPVATQVANIFINELLRKIGLGRGGTNWN
jgi:hypothetical protein